MKIHLIEMMNLLVLIRRSRLDVEHEEYNRVIDTELISAIKRCENEEQAIFDLSYPLSESGMLHGYMGVKTYMLNLFYENRFCSKFDADEIKKLENIYMASESGKVACNIHNKVYMNALFCEYLQKDVGTLTITLEDCAAAQKLLGDFDEQKQYELLAEASNKMSGTETHNYNAKLFERISPKILAAIKKKKLPSILTVEK